MRQMQSRLLFKHASELIRDGRFDEATTLLDKLTAAHPKSAACYYCKVLAEFKAHNEEELVLRGERIYESENFITACRCAGVIGNSEAESSLVTETPPPETAAINNDFTENETVLFPASAVDIDENGNIVLKAPDPDDLPATVENETLFFSPAARDFPVTADEPQTPRAVINGITVSPAGEISRGSQTEEQRETAAKIRSLEERINLAFPHLNLSVRNLVLPTDSDEQYALESGGTMSYAPLNDGGDTAAEKEIAAKPCMEKVNVLRSEKRAASAPAAHPPAHTAKKYSTLPGTVVALTVILVMAITAAAITPLRGISGIVTQLKALPVSERISDSTIDEVLGKQLTNVKYTRHGGTLFSKFIEHDSNVYIDISGEIGGYSFTVRFRCEYESGKDEITAGRENLFARIRDNINPGGYEPYIEYGTFNGHTLDSDSAYTLLTCLLVTYDRNTGDTAAFLTEHFGFDADNPLEFTSKMDFEARDKTVYDIISQKYDELKREGKEN